jgi:hypothetical protein
MCLQLLSLKKMFALVRSLCHVVIVLVAPGLSKTKTSILSLLSPSNLVSGCIKTFVMRLKHVEVAVPSIVE